MHRISNGTQINTEPGIPAVIGTPGYYTAGVPGVQAATAIDATQLNAVQEELAHVVESAGIALDKANNVQLLAALRLLFLSRGQGSYPGFFVDAAPGVRGFTVPEHIYTVRITVLGGGGGGTGANPNQGGSGYYLSGSGGGSGGLAIGAYAVTPGQVLQYTVGAGGTPGSGADSGQNAQGNGGSGGTSSVAALIAASGGGGGIWAAITSSAGGTEGLGYGGALVAAGGYGSDGQNGASEKAGNGASSPYGGGGRAGAGGGFTAVSPGAGGGGGYDAACDGGAGAPGLVIIEF